MLDRRPGISRPSRRTFLRLALLGAGSIVLNGCDTQTTVITKAPTVTPEAASTIPAVEIPTSTTVVVAETPTPRVTPMLPPVAEVSPSPVAAATEAPLAYFMPTVDAVKLYPEPTFGDFRGGIKIPYNSILRRAGPDFIPDRDPAKRNPREAALVWRNVITVNQNPPVMGWAPADLLTSHIPESLLKSIGR